MKRVKLPTPFHEWLASRGDSLLSIDRVSTQDVMWSNDRIQSLHCAAQRIVDQF